jgi:hypothetical protein
LFFAGMTEHTYTTTGVLGMQAHAQIDNEAISPYERNASSVQIIKLPSTPNLRKC